MQFPHKLIAVCLFTLLLASCSIANKTLSDASDDLPVNYRLKVIIQASPGMFSDGAFASGMLEVSAFGTFPHPELRTYQVHSDRALHQLQDYLISTGMVINMTVEKQ